MSVNSFKPHVYVLPEDDANGSIATGFALDVRHPRNIQVLPPAGGWTNARDAIQSEHANGLRRFPGRLLVLVVDFDDRLDRAATIIEGVPEDLKARVFVLGAKTEPERLKQAKLGTFEQIGQGLAADCRDGTSIVSGHDQLKHNLDELMRLKAAAFGIVF